MDRYATIADKVTDKVATKILTPGEYLSWAKEAVDKLGLPIHEAVAHIKTAIEYTSGTDRDLENLLKSVERLKKEADTVSVSLKRAMRNRA